jgi:hypothetical protein
LNRHIKRLAAKTKIGFPETYTSIDVSEPGLQPLLMGGKEEILLQRVFEDAVPNIIVTVYRWPPEAPNPKAPAVKREAEEDWGR